MTAASSLTPAFVQAAHARLTDARGRTPSFSSLHAADDRQTAVAVLEWAFVDGARLVASTAEDPRFGTTRYDFGLADRFESRQLLRADYQLQFLGSRTDIGKVDEMWESIRPMLAWTFTAGQQMVETLAAEMPASSTRAPVSGGEVAEHVPRVAPAVRTSSTPRVASAPRATGAVQLGLL